MPGQTFDTVPHVLLAAHGSMPGGESWSCGLRTSLTAAPTPQADLQTVATAAAVAWGVLFSVTNIGFAIQTTLTGVTARSLDARGITTTLAEGVPTTSPTPGTTASKLPNQDALCVTLFTARAGRTGKGRFYLPVTGITTDDTGNYPTGNLSPFVGAVATCLNSINTALAALPSAPKIAVQSKKGETNLGEGYTGAVVTKIGIGNVFDTQRRRRASRVEAYTYSDIA